jgi:hypothetical protein
MTDPRINSYEQRYAIRLLHRLGPGPGQDGFVMQSTRRTAVKFFDRAARYVRELEVYRVLESKGIHSVAGHNVPEFLSADDDLLALEISIVQRPFILDFAGARKPDEVPDFESLTLQEHHQRLEEMFGSRWTDALQVADAFRIITGFTLLDIHPGNIAFAD